MRYRVRRPCPALAPFVRSFWYFESTLPHARERVLPTGKMQLLINVDEGQLGGHGQRPVRMPGAVLVGARSQHDEIGTDAQRAIVGVDFHAGGAYPFFEAPAQETTNSTIELDALWGRDGAVLRERLLEAQRPAAMLRALESVVLARAVRTLRPDPALEFTLREFGKGAAIGAVTERLGMTPRRFIRSFSDQVGLTPKLFARVGRFQRVLAASRRCAGRPIDWAQIALDCGYSDQAHLIHEFRAFSGMTPTAYMPRADSLGHVPIR
jgi:AraC-like DNA-binding protein